MLGPTDAATGRQPAAAAATGKADRMDWWREARFGMFIHWGLYAIPAGEWGDKKDHGEWIMNTAHIPVEDYEKYREKFNPVKFDAGKIVQAAKAAGMKYIVITSKHHDGFCLFDSKETDYDVMSTPFKARHHERAGRGLPQGGDPHVLVPLHHGLAPPGLHAAAGLGEAVGRWR
jgi:hypothetical protein